jgi:hypothetical protein
MGKESHVIRIWVSRGGRRVLEASFNSHNARALAASKVEALKQDMSAVMIEMREHIVTNGDDGDRVGRRGTLRWERTRRGWRELPVANIRVVPRAAG